MTGLFYSTNAARKLRGRPRRTLTRRRNGAADARWLLFLLVFCLYASVPVGVNAGLPDVVRERLAGAFEEAVRANGGDYSGRAVIMPLEGAKSPTRALDDVVQFFTAQWTAHAGASAADPTTSAELLGGMLLEKTDLLNDEYRNAFLSTAGADVLVLTAVLPEESDLCIVITFCRFDQEAVRKKVTVEKTDDLRRYLGEPIPGTLIVRAPDDARITADGSFLGTGGSPLRCRLAPGQHEIRVTKTDFPPHTRTLRMMPESQVEMVVRQKDNSAAPVLALLSSAVLPGLGAAVYGRPATEQAVQQLPEAVTFASALLFYVAATMWIVDETKEVDFLSRKSSDRYESIKKGELYCAGAAYAVNLVASFIVGKQYAEKNRQLVSSVDRP